MYAPEAPTNLEAMDTSNLSDISVQLAEKTVEVNDDPDGTKEEERVLQTISAWIMDDISATSATFNPAVLKLMPFLSQYVGTETGKESSQYCLKALCYISSCYIPSDYFPVIIEMARKLCSSSSYKTKLNAIEYLQTFVFFNFMALRTREKESKELEEIILAMMLDEHVTVKAKASKNLSGLLHCDFISGEDQMRLLAKFRSMCRQKMSRSGSKNKKFRKVSVKKESMATYHCGILGLCAFVEAYPYDIPEFMPDILMELGNHLHDPQPIPKDIKATLQNFKRTHQANWQEHRLKFSEDQLSVMTDLLVSPNYYA